MPSLGDAYATRRGGDDRRLALFVGVVTFLSGVVALFAGVALVALEPGGQTRARRLAGVVGGIGLPLVLLGVVTVLPAQRTERGLTAAGAVLCLAATVLFWTAYPDRWLSLAAGDRTLEISLLYLIGAVLALWFVLRALATFKTRNDPKGTVTLEITRDGGTKTVEVDPREVDSPEKLRRRARELDRADGGPAATADGGDGD